MKKHNLSCYEPLNREPQNSFNKFIIYRDLKPYDRTLEKTAEKIIHEQGLTPADEKYQLCLNREKSKLMNLSAKWCWTERVKIYDADQQLKLAKKRETNFDDLSNVLLDNVEGLIKYANNLLGEVIKNPVKENGEPYSLITRIKMSKDVSNLLKEAHELLCNLCGRPSSYSSFEFDGLIDVNATVVEEETEEEKLERYANYFKQIDTGTEGNISK